MRASTAALIAATLCVTVAASSEIVVRGIRVQALSPTLLRIEPKGPLGFEDRTSLTVTNRDFNTTQIALTVTNQTAEGTWLSTTYYSVFIQNVSVSPQTKVTSPDGVIIWQSSNTVENQNLLHWPDPLTTKGYGLVDHPRIYVPPWASTPMPTGQTLHKETNGYDLSNDIDKDTYVFILGEDLDGWHNSRHEFVKLVGGTPLLPDYAYGTWFTYWHAYTEAEAKSDLARWDDDQLPIDVWALDMNWRNTSHDQDHFYNHPATELFTNYSEWFGFLKTKNLRTYFNDHPYPVAQQASPAEVAFRWAGLKVCV
jgi:alpha-glucosidase (family GH31 glycosyl hydrolase)